MKDFFLDASKTFLHFAISPLQWLFWRFPRVYEVLVTTIIFWKNTLPTKTELLHTYYHWISLFITSITVCLNYISLSALYAHKTLLNYNKNIIDKIKDLK